MKRILLLLLFNFSVIAAFGQAYGNAYFKSTHIINSDSTHGELDGTEYRGSNGQFRYKENGVWKYRASTADLAGLGGITNSAAANEIMMSDGTNAVSSNLYMTGTSQLNLGNSSLSGSARVITTEGSATSVGLWLQTKNSTNSELTLTAGQTGKVIATTHSFAVSTIVTPFKLRTRSTTGVAAGIGVGLDFETATQDNNANYETGSVIESVSTDVTAGSEDFDLIFKTMSAGATADEKLRISSAGILQLSGGATIAPGGTINNASGFDLNYNGGTRLRVQSNGIGITNATTGIGIVGRTLHVATDDASNSTVNYAAKFAHYTTGTPATGIGVGVEFDSETSASNFETGSIIESVSTDVTGGSEDFDLVFKNMAAGTMAAEKFRITSAGNATLVGTGTGVDWVATSDRRLKYHFKPVNSQLDKISAISNIITNYDRKDNGKNETGFIAQELLKVAPEYVNTPIDTASGYYSVNYSKMVVPLYKGVDELQEEVTELRQEIAELKVIIKEFRRIALEASLK